MSQRKQWFTILVAVLTIGVIGAVFANFRVHNPQQVQHQIYQQWRRAYVRPHGPHTTFVNAGTATHPQALSEAQGYGLWITTLAGARGWASQQDFDALLAYYQDYQPPRGRTHLMQWRQYRDPKGHWVSDVSSATDGDLYIAMALGRAARVWPRRAPIYQRLERQLAADILQHEYNPATGCLTTGDWARPHTAAGRLLRTSDVMPIAFDQLAHDTGDRRWVRVKGQMLTRLADLAGQHRSGLVPDFAVVTATSARAVKANQVAGPHDGDYGPNACRVPLMLAHSRDPQAQRIEGKLLRFFSRQPYVAEGYTLTGRPLAKHRSASFSAPVFAAVNQHRGQGYDQLFANEKYVFSHPLPRHEYYGATLTTLVALEGW